MIMILTMLDDGNGDCLMMIGDDNDGSQTKPLLISRFSKKTKFLKMITLKRSEFPATNRRDFAISGISSPKKLADLK